MRRRRIDDADVVKSPEHLLARSVLQLQLKERGFEVWVEGRKQQVEIEDPTKPSELDCPKFFPFKRLSSTSIIPSFLGLHTIQQVRTIHRARTQPTTPHTEPYVRSFLELSSTSSRRRGSFPNSPTVIHFLLIARSRTLAPNHRPVFTFENPSENPPLGDIPAPSVSKLNPRVW